MTFLELLDPDEEGIQMLTFSQNNAKSLPVDMAIFQRPESPVTS
jgi:hypothetical protein